MYFERLWKLFVRVLFGNELILLPENRNARVKASVIIAVPIILQNLVRHFQLMIDRFFLGNLDPLYLSVVGNVNVPFSTLDLFLLATGTGLSVLSAQALGAKDMERAKLLSESSFAFMTVIGGIIFGFWQVAATPVFRLLGADEALLGYVVDYVRILAFSTLFLGIDVTSGSVLASCGITSPIMLVGLLKNALNLFLDWVLIFGRFGLPELGVAGAAWATVASNAIGAIVLFVVMLRHPRMPFRLAVGEILRARWRAFLDVLRVGLPSGLETFLWFVGQTYVLRLMNGLGPYAAGIYTVAHDIFILALFVYMGFSRSTLTLVGQFWGARRFREAKLAGWEGQTISFGISLVWALILFMWGGDLIRIFTTDAGVVREGAGLMRVAGLFVVFQTFNVVIGNAIRATGDTLWMLWTQIFGTVFVVVVSYVLIFLVGLGLMGVIWTLTIDEFLRGSINSIRFGFGGEHVRRAEMVEEGT